MRVLQVSGLSADGTRLVLRAGTEVFELPLADVPQGRQPALPFAGDVPPTPRQIQQRLRCGETVAQIADDTGLSVAAVDRYAGPILAERGLQAERARGARFDGRVVEDLVLEHLTGSRSDPDAVLWDSWLTEQGPWEVRACAGSRFVRLSWEPAARRVKGLDEPSRQALRSGPMADPALEEILAPGRPAAPGSRTVVPLWDDRAADHR